MRVLVIGGSGLMGSATVRQLLAAGDEPISMARGGTVTESGGLPREALPEQIVSLVQDRAADRAGFRRLLHEHTFDAIVDYCAMAPEHVDDVVSAFRAGDQAKLRAYLFISTNMVYPGGPGGMDISRLRPLVPERRADLAAAAGAPDDYGGRKLRCEAALDRAWREYGFPVTVIRPPSVIGPACDQRHELLQRVAMGLAVPKTKDRSAAACPDGGFRLAYSEDVAGLCLAVLRASPETVRGEAFNVAMTEAVTLEEYIEACRDVAPEAVAAAWPTPAAAAAALAALGPALRSYEGQACLDVSKARSVLGWEPTPWADAIKATAEWHRPLLAAAAASSV